MTTVRQILELKGGEVITGDRWMTLAQAAARLSERRIGALIFADEEQRIAGILSERDIVRAVALHGGRVLEELATAHMTRHVSVCSREDTVEDVMETMTAGRFRHLPVVDAGRLIGMISIGDVVKQRLADIEHQASEIRNYLHAT